MVLMQVLTLLFTIIFYSKDHVDTINTKDSYVNKREHIKEVREDQES